MILFKIPKSKNKRASAFKSYQKYCVRSFKQQKPFDQEKQYLKPIKISKGVLVDSSLQKSKNKSLKYSNL